MFVVPQHLIPLHGTKQELRKCVLNWFELVFTILWKPSDILVRFCNLRLLKKMDRDSSRLRRLMAVASTCRVKMDRRGKDPAAWFSQHEPASLFPTLGSHYKAPAPHKHCLSNALHYHVSSKTRGVRVTEGCHEAEMFPVCSVGRGETWAPDGTWQLISFLCQKWSFLLC